MIKLYIENEHYKLYQGNMLDMLESIKPNTIDSIVTDPPYELNFMNKGWDNSGIAFQKETWQKCYEVLKSGGYLLAFGGSRTFHRIACAIEDVGFEIRDTIMWLYGSGFPKSMDISKQIDRRGAVSTSWFGEYLKNTLKERNMTQSDLAKHFPSKTGGLTGCVHNWIEGKNMPTIEQFNKICEILDLPFDKLEEAEREVIGKKEYTNDKNVMNISNYNGERVHLDITAPSTDLAKQWQGWGTALKPSYEPIIVARKPFKGSCVDNVIEYGVGGINIDECRVGTDVIKGGTMPKLGAGEMGVCNYQTVGAERIEREDSVGRFPANTILTYDETPNDERLRYFYCAKASKKDRDEGLEEFETKSHEEINNRKEHSAGATRQYGGGTNPFLSVSCPRKNVHPTVKPTELMQYLVRLVTPKNGTVLDPFNGSGSTGKAVMYENRERNKNYKYIGIELTEEYLPISKARIEYVVNLPKEEKQLNLFDLLEEE